MKKTLLSLLLLAAGAAQAQTVGIPFSLYFNPHATVAFNGASGAATFHYWTPLGDPGYFSGYLTGTLSLTQTPPLKPTGYCPGLDASGSVSELDASGHPVATAELNLTYYCLKTRSYPGKWYIMTIPSTATFTQLPPPPPPPPPCTEDCGGD
jgi:hypothetical protein